MVTATERKHAYHAMLDHLGDRLIASGDSIAIRDSLPIAIPRCYVNVAGLRAVKRLDRAAGPSKHGVPFATIGGVGSGVLLAVSIARIFDEHDR